MNGIALFIIIFAGMLGRNYFGERYSPVWLVDLASFGIIGVLIYFIFVRPYCHLIARLGNDEDQRFLLEFPPSDMSVGAYFFELYMSMRNLRVNFVSWNHEGKILFSSKSYEENLEKFPGMTSDKSKVFMRESIDKHLQLFGFHKSEIVKIDDIMKKRGLVDHADGVYGALTHQGRYLLCCNKRSPLAKGFEQCIFLNIDNSNIDSNNEIQKFCSFFLLERVHLKTFLQKLSEIAKRVIVDEAVNSLLTFFLRMYRCRPYVEILSYPFDQKFAADVLEDYIEGKEYCPEFFLSLLKDVLIREQGRGMIMDLMECLNALVLGCVVLKAQQHVKRIHQSLKQNSSIIAIGENPLQNILDDFGSRFVLHTLTIGRADRIDFEKFLRVNITSTPFQIIGEWLKDGNIFKEKV